MQVIAVYVMQVNDVGVQGDDSGQESPGGRFRPEAMAVSQPGFQHVPPHIPPVDGPE